jgi:hypothetical protein
MAITANDRKYMETVLSLGLKRAFAGKPSAAAKLSLTTKAISTDWINNLKRVTLRIVLLLALLGVGCYAYSEHAKLQTATNAYNQVVNSSLQQVEKLAQLAEQANILHNELDSTSAELTATKAKLVTNESTLLAVNQQLSMYGFSGPVSQFASYNNLIAWLKTDNTHKQVYSSTFTCVDFASMMAEHAIRDGYWIFPAIVLTDNHMECIAPIGNDIYTIEPQTNAVTLFYIKGQ